MTRARLDVNLWDDRGQFLGYIPAWENFLAVCVADSIPTGALLVEQRARYCYVLSDDGRGLQSHLEFDTEADLLLFLLRFA